MNVTPGHSYQMSDKIEKFTLDGEDNNTNNP